MRSTWPFLAATGAIGLAIGTWIAGIPSSSADITVADGVSGSLVPGITAAPSGSTYPPITVTPTTYRTAPTTEPPADSTTTTTTPPDTTVAPTTVPETVPETVPPTVAPTTPATTSELLDRSAVRLVLANGDGRYNLVGRNVDRLEPLGYTQIDQTDAPTYVDRTILYYRPGFDDEATRLAADLLVPGALLEPLPDQPVTINDEKGDIIVVLGPDAVR
ncbi:MAG: LytR C-terminal domain-containing protein [Acidimicrobiales bacterium]